jgi:hypothetical protein
MKRDMDIFRELLLRLESYPMEYGSVHHLTGEEPELAVAGATLDQIRFHLDLLRETGLIICPGSQPMLGITFERLSWNGFDFLDSVRSSEVWAKTKKGAEAAGGWTVDLLMDLAKGFIRKQIEDRTGIKLP